MFTCNHITIRTSNIERAKEFYISKLGLTLLGDKGQTFAVKVGEIRLSFFPSEADTASAGRMDLILRTENVDESFKELKAAAVTILEEIIEAPGFMRFFTIEDPDGNILHIAQYLRDPLAGY